MVDTETIVVLVVKKRLGSFEAINDIIHMICCTNHASFWVLSCHVQCQWGRVSFFVTGAQEQIYSYFQEEGEISQMT